MSSTDSILSDMRALVLSNESSTDFDKDLIIHINSTFSLLHQLGAGPPEGFSIEDDSAIWASFSSDETLLGLVKTFMFLNLRLIFDPPVNSFTLESMKQQIEEYKWRINVVVDRGEVT